MGWLKYIKGAGSNIHKPGDKPDIFIFATPRSGSTFLMELLGAQPGMKVFDEPLTVNYPESRRELGITTWEELTIMPDREQRYKRFFQRLLDNRIKELNRPLYAKYGRLFTNRVVIKNIHGGKDMLPWFAETFKAQILVLLRHPIPTVLSHQKFPRLPFLLHQPSHRRLFSAQEIAFAEQVVANGSKLEQGMIDWSLEIAAMFRNPWPDATIISYEDLTVFPRESFDYLQHRLNLQPVGDVHALAAQASVSTGQSDAETRRFFANGAADRSFLISRWTSRVSGQEIKRAFEIAGRFGLDQYTEGDLFPSAPYRIPFTSPVAGQGLSSGVDPRVTPRSAAGVLAAPN